MIYNADNLAGWVSYRQLPDGRWVLERPLRFAPLWFRLRTAWRVFRGRYDALEWTGQEDVK